MGKNTGAAKYAFGNLLFNAFPMYLFGSSLITGWQFFAALLRTQSVESAVGVALRYYVAKLTPFPLNEFLTASGFQEVTVNIAVALAVGLVVATARWRRNV